MKKRIRITEKQIDKAIGKAINEISYGMVDDAYQKDYNLFNSIINSHEKFQDSLNELKSDFKYLEQELHFNDDYNPFNSLRNNPYFNKINVALNEIGSYIDNIESISNNLNQMLTRKENQIDNFNKSIMHYDDAHSNDDASWNEYRKGEIHNT